MRKWNIVIGLITLLTTAANAGANEQTIFQIGVSAFVPINCHADVIGTPAPAAGLVDLGTLHEFCNDPAGYQVWADSTPGASGTAFLVDGRRVALSATGVTMISNSSTAASRLHHLQLAGKIPQTISIRIVAL